jgi:hypothetical protein
VYLRRPGRFMWTKIRFAILPVELPDSMIQRSNDGSTSGDAEDLTMQFPRRPSFESVELRRARPDDGGDRFADDDDEVEEDELEDDEDEDDDELEDEDFADDEFGEDDDDEFDDDELEDEEDEEAEEDGEEDVVDDEEEEEEEEDDE